ACLLFAATLSVTILSLDGCPIWFTAPKLQDFLACVQPGEPSLPASARTYATSARLHLGRSSDRDTTKLLSETRYEPLNRFALATEKHFPRSFTRPTLGGDLNSYVGLFQNLIQLDRLLFNVGNLTQFN
ncbi:hypothetical protein, partial [Ferrimicrobium acidiphilum]|uniref:hypothetical protein n=1 Tax=Ferrimicrobium acidiphilum TaxID=121039 RepID=UPI00146FD705